MPGFSISCNNALFMNAPIYQHIKENLKMAILSGCTMPGQRLPSVRRLVELCKTGLVILNREEICRGSGKGIDGKGGEW